MSLLGNVLSCLLVHSKLKGTREDNYLLYFFDILGFFNKTLTKQSLYCRKFQTMSNCRDPDGELDVPIEEGEDDLWREEYLRMERLSKKMANPVVFNQISSLNVVQVLIYHCYQIFYNLIQTNFTTFCLAARTLGTLVLKQSARR